MANFITTLRIILSIILLFFKPLSIEFYSIYILAGFTDMIDGFVARKTNTVSNFGAKLDTIADFTFLIACFVKLIPIIKFQIWMYIFIVVIAIIKIINIISGYIKHKKLVFPHTIMNKITGAILFIFPLTLSHIDLVYSAIVILLIASFAAIQEGHLIRTKEIEEL